MQKTKSRVSRLLKGLVFLSITLALGFCGGRIAAYLLRGSFTAQNPSPSDSSEQTLNQFDNQLVLNSENAAQGDPANGAAETPSGVWSQETAPNYYRVLGHAQVVDAPSAGEVLYGELDSLGRSTGVVANVTFDLMQNGIARPRGDLSGLTPTGWGHNREVDIAMPDGTIYHGFLYNRSHLLAKSLGGDDDLHNLITATRTQNVGSNFDGVEGGMAYCEGIARNWLWAHKDGTVIFRAVPRYVGKNLVAHCVVVDLLSNDGSLNQRIEVYNAARGFTIDYATGEFKVTENAEEAAADIRNQLDSKGFGTPAEQPDEASSVVPQGSPESETGERMVIVTGSGEAYHHDETCSGLAHAKSMRWVTVSEAEEMDRHPCGICGG